MLDALRTAALANPDDLTTLRIYADALVERGDPEGERILLTVNDEFPHQATWRDDHLLGRLRKSVASCTVFRGLLWDVTLSRVTPREFTRLIGRPEWRTVRTLHFLRGRLRSTQLLPAWECAQLVSHPVMESLRQVTGFDLAALQLLGARTRPVEIEGINALCRHSLDGPEGAMAALPKLKRLALSSCHAGHVTALLSSTFWRGLRILELDLHPGQIHPGVLGALLEPGSQLEFLQLGPCVAVREADGWALTIDTEGLDVGDLLIDLEQLGRGVGAVCLRGGELPAAIHTTLLDLARANAWELRLEECPAGEWIRVQLPQDDDAPF